MKFSQAILSFCVLSAIECEAFPQLLPKVVEVDGRNHPNGNDCPYSAMPKEQKRQLSFDPTTQYVSTTGKHAFVAPNFAAGDQRGPCPGLNALANHGYLPHSGVADLITITEAVNDGILEISTSSSTPILLHLTDRC